MDDDPIEQVKGFLKDKLQPEDFQRLEAMIAKIGAGAEGEGEAAPAPKNDAENPAPKDPAQDGDDPNEEKKDMVTKPAMDAAVAAAEKRATVKATESVLKLQREIRDAERDVRPYVGDLTVACDSAAAVYRAALETLGEEDVASIHPSALKRILLKHPLPGAKPAAKAIAQDSSADAEYAKRFPDAGRLAR